MPDPIEPIPGNQRMTVPSHLLSGAAGDHHVLRVVGDSMTEEHILDGDYAVIQGRGTALDGEVVVAVVGGDATFKRYHPEGDTVRLKPLNPAMPDILVRASDLEIRGVVVGLMRKF